MNKYLTLTEAANSLPGRPSASAVWRWARKGVKTRAGTRLLLPHVRVGGRLYVEQSALDDFCEALAQDDVAYFTSIDAGRTPDGVEKRARSPKQRAADIDRARRTLDEK